MTAARLRLGGEAGRRGRGRCGRSCPCALRAARTPGLQDLGPPAPAPPSPSTRWKGLSGLWSETERQVSLPRGPEYSQLPAPTPPQEPSGTPLPRPEPDAAWPGSRAGLGLCPCAAGLNGLRDRQSNRAPVGGAGRRRARTAVSLWMFHRESLPRALPRDVPRSPSCSNITDSPLNSPIQGRQGPKGFYNATASLWPSHSHLSSTAPPRFPPCLGTPTLPWPPGA